MQKRKNPRALERAAGGRSCSPSSLPQRARTVRLKREDYSSDLLVGWQGASAVRLAPARVRSIKTRRMCLIDGYQPPFLFTEIHIEGYGPVVRVESAEDALEEDLARLFATLGGEVLS